MTLEMPPFILILLLTCDWWMTEFNKIKSTLADLMKFGMQTYVKVCFCTGWGEFIRSHVCVYVCDWRRERGGGGWRGITLMKNKFQKASITSAQARAPAFAFQCEVQPPLFMMLYTSKPRPASLYLTHSCSLSLSPLIPIVTTSPGSPETLSVWREREEESCLWDGSVPAGIWWVTTCKKFISDSHRHWNMSTWC